MTSTIPTTLAEYQKYVREQALQIQVDMDWPDEKLNETLKALGLPEKKVFRLPLKVTGTVTVLAKIDDAETEEEAREKAAAKDSASLMDMLSQAGFSYGHFGSLAAEPGVMPDEDHLKVGDIDLTLSGNQYSRDRRNAGLTRSRCDNYSNTGWYCTRPVGHDGDHAVGNSQTITHVWAQA